MIYMISQNPNRDPKNGSADTGRRGSDQALDALTTPGSDSRAGSAVIQIPVELKRYVIEQHESISKLRGEWYQLGKQLEQLSSDNTASASKAGFRERYLPLWLCRLLGGDTTMVTQLSGQEAQKTELEKQKEGKWRRMHWEEDWTQDKIHDFLVQANPRYKRVSDGNAATNKAKEAGEEFLDLIEKALSEVSGAESMEMIDLFTKSKAASVLSHSYASDANSAIRRVRSGADRYKAALTACGKALSSSGEPKGDISINDTPDLIADFMFNGCTITSLFTLSQLDNADCSLGRLRDQVEEAQGKLGDYASKLDAFLEEQRGKVERECLLS